jgi:polyhydroxybutyrate depolymerase
VVAKKPVVIRPAIAIAVELIETRRMKSMALCLLVVAVMPQLLAADPYPALEHRKFAHDGVQREYFVHVPEYPAGPLPVVLALHGYTSTATGFAAFHDLRLHADENAYIVVYPQGTHFVASDTENPYRITSWNLFGVAIPDSGAGPLCTEEAYEYLVPPDCETSNRCTWASCGDDIGYFEKLLDDVAAEFNTDTNRYYVLGMSNGGMMTLRLGCDMSDRFAAIAPIDAQLANGYNCGPDTDLPMIHLSGGKDDTVRGDGQPGGDGFIYVSIRDTTSIWAKALQCDAHEKPWTSPAAAAAGLECMAFSYFNVGGLVVVCFQDPEETHNWPARRPGGAWPTCVTSQQAESMPEQRLCEARLETGPHLGMDLIWSFFSRYSRQQALE